MAALTEKPANLTFEEAAVLGGGITAQTFLGRTSMGPGTSALVNRLMIAEQFGMLDWTH
jgi:hypothetical protein